MQFFDKGFLQKHAKCRAEFMNIMPCILWAPEIYAFEVQFLRNLHYEKTQSKVRGLIDQTALIYVAPVTLTWPSRVTPSF